MTARWEFPVSGPGLTDYHRFPTEGALDSDLETFVREVLQNANDQRPDEEDEPVQVRFRLEEVAGSDLEEFLTTLDWDRPGGLKDHLRWATRNDQNRVPGLKKYLDNFEEERLLVLVVEDWNTTGLIGGEKDGNEPYGALVQDWGSTDKPSSNSGGSHGLGKSVLWAFSGFSTALFCSTPREVPDEGDVPPRLVGRCIVPVHDHDGDGSPRYTSHGWFGQTAYDEDEISRPPSVWGNSEPSADELAEVFQIDRAREVPGDGRDGNEVPGTSIGIVGFRLPGEDLEPDPYELAPRLREASAKYFWPAMVDGDLEVSVQTPDGEFQQVTFDDAPGVEPFVECYRDRFDIDDETTELEGPGSLVKSSVDLWVPREDPDVVEDAPHGEFDTECDLLIRRPTPREFDQLETSTDDDLSLNRVARLRGARMVVDYVSKEQVTTREREFVAVLVCGTARAEPDEDPSPADEAAEEFLKRAEPTQHDDWVASGNNYLKDFYIGNGLVSAIEGLGGSRLEGALADVVGVDVESGDEVPGLGDLLPVMSGFTGPTERDNPLLSWDRRPDPSFVEDEGRWTFEGFVRPNREEVDEWSVTIKLVERDEENRVAGHLDFEVTSDTEGVDPPDGPVAEAELTCSGDVSRLHFEGTSMRVDDPDIDRGRVTETEVSIDGKVVSGAEE